MRSRIGDLGPMGKLNYTFNELVSLIKELGWKEQRHNVFIHSQSNQPIVIHSHGSKVVPAGTAYRILKTARSVLDKKN